MKRNLRVWQIVMLGVLFASWQAATQPDLIPPFVWENPNRAAFFFGEPLKIFRVIWDWFTDGTIYKHLGVTLVEPLLRILGTTSKDLRVIQVQTGTGAVEGRSALISATASNCFACMLLLYCICCVVALRRHFLRFRTLPLANCSGLESEKRRPKAYC